MSPTVLFPTRPTHRLAPPPAPQRLALAALLLAAVSLGCSADRTSRTLLTQPHGGDFTIEGNVLLTGVMQTDEQVPLGDLIVDAANDCKIHVEGPEGHRDSTLTHDGEYHFHVDHPGLYRVSCCVVAGDTAASVDVVVADDDTTVVASVLSLPSPAGNINGYPNPLDAHGAGVETNLTTPQHVEIFITTLYGFRVWTYAFDAAAGFHHIHWPAVNDAGQPVPDGPYWAVVHADGAYSFTLLSKQTTPAPGVARRGRSSALR